MNWIQRFLTAIVTHKADPNAHHTPTAIPSGLIAIWHGLIANIPSGFVICDGNNSTPNLLAKFVEGVATAATNPGATGGATNKTTAGHATPSHTLTVTEMPAHTHVIKTRDGAAVNPDRAQISDGTADSDIATDAAGGDGGHTHGSVTDSIADIRPLFYDIAFLMKT